MKLKSKKLLTVPVAKIVVIIFSFAALMVTGSVVNAASIVLNGPSADDVDIVEPVLVDLTTAATGTIMDLDLFVHTTGAGYDLSVILTHVDTSTNATIWLSTGSDDDVDGLGNDLNGFGHTFGEVNTTFDDEAPLAFHPNYDQDGVPNAPSYRPVDLLSVFDGENITGTWQLSIQNTGCCLFEGQDLVAWSITADLANGSEVPEPTTMLLFGAGLIGLAGISRKRR